MPEISAILRDEALRIKAYIKEGHTVEAAAEHFNLSVSTVNARLNLANFIVK